MISKEPVLELKFSELNRLQKEYDSSTTLGKSVQSEIQRRLLKRHTYRPFKSLKGII